jgi:hypothetical protein
MASTGAHEASAQEGEGNGLDSSRELNQATRDPPGCGVNRPARNAVPIRPEGHELSRGENRPVRGENRHDSQLSRGENRLSY